MKYIYISLWLTALWLMSAAEHGAAGWTGLCSLIIGGILLCITLFGIYVRR